MTTQERALVEARKKVELVKEELFIFMSKSRLRYKVGVKEILKVVGLVDEVLMCFSILDIEQPIDRLNAEAVSQVGSSKDILANRGDLLPSLDKPIEPVLEPPVPPSKGKAKTFAQIKMEQIQKLDKVIEKAAMEQLKSRVVVDVK